MRDLRSCSRWLGLAFAVVVGATACGDDPPTVCTLELGLALGPRDTTLSVGAVLMPRAELTSCGGRVREPARVVMTSTDPSVVEVRASPQHLVALRSGQVYIGVVDSTEGPMGSIRVRVVP